MLTNKERLIWDANVRGCLDCSDHKVVEYRILKGGRREKAGSQPGLQAFCSYISSKRKTRETVGLVLNGARDMVKRARKRLRYSLCPLHLTFCW